MNKNMVKVGKIYVNSSISPRTYLLLTLLGLIFLIVVIIFTINNYKKTKNYIKITAEIRDKYVIEEENYDDEIRRSNYISVSYAYNDKQYTSEQQVFFKFNKHIGDKISILINPENPEEMKNLYMPYGIYIVDIIAFVWTIGVGFCYKARKNFENDTIIK